MNLNVDTRAQSTIGIKLTQQYVDQTISMFNSFCYPFYFLFMGVDIYQILHFVKLSCEFYR